MIDPQTRRVRRFVSIALIIYCAAIVVLTLHSLDEAGWENWVSAVLATLAAIGLVAHASDRIYLPGENYAYLVTGWAGLTTLGLYLVETADTPLRRLSLSLLLLVGIVGGYGAHLGAEPGGRGRRG